MKNEYIQKASLRLRQAIKVLVSKPSFLNAVLILRKKWEIPNEGFKSQTNLDKWYQKINENTEEYFNQFWPSKRQELVELKSKSNFAEHKKALDEFNNKAPRNAFLIDVKKLTHEQKLSPRWIEGIKRFLLFNNPDNMGMFVGPVISTKFDSEFKTETIYLGIEANTTLEDVKAIWPEIKEMQARLPHSKQKKFQPLRKFDRNKIAYELHLAGKKYREIAEAFSKNKKAIGEEDVAKMIERYKKKVDINQA
jgi:hypothetical protein